MENKIKIISDTTDGGIRTVVAQPCEIVCSEQIEVKVKDGTVISVQFTRGCHGNTQGVAALCAGRTAKEICNTLKGINCKGKGTSCPDQLAQTMEYISNE